MGRSTTCSILMSMKRLHGQAKDRHGLAIYVTLGSAIAFTFGWHVHEKVVTTGCCMGVVFFFPVEEEGMKLRSWWQNNVVGMMMNSSDFAMSRSICPRKLRQRK